MKNIQKKSAYMLVAALTLVPSLAAAQDADTNTNTNMNAVAASETSTENGFDMAAITDSNLDDVRGTSSTTLTAETLGVAVLSGTASGNTTNGGVTGANNIGGDAFNNANGISFVVQNSGNNAVVNAAMVVNLSVTQ